MGALARGIAPASYTTTGDTTLGKFAIRQLGWISESRQAEWSYQDDAEVRPLRTDLSVRRPKSR
jgi:hypothetical protein